MKILGLDIGSKRIGVAVSDPLGITAQGLLTLEKTKDADFIKRLRDIILKEEIKEIVVGLPLNMNGSCGPQAKGAISFADNLKDKFEIPVKLWDERMSTMEVERIMIQADTSRSKRKKKIDKLAAQVILQSYLNARGNNGG
ncbi:MAG: Holliday junction resolvase RuvX [Candidatus Omnitrophota bacterium]|nr:MAG: Holliday junction resolvase RuvX [Candidatus Omnitrophota bacterium]